jgi:hypothetical protein
VIDVRFWKSQLGGDYFEVFVRISNDTGGLPSLPPDKNGPALQPIADVSVNARDIRWQRIYRSINECVARATGEVVAVNKTSGNTRRDVESRGAGRYGSWSSVRV